MKQFNHQAPIRPLVVLVMDEAGHRRSPPVDLDLAVQLHQPKRAIASLLDPAALEINPSLYLEKEAA